VKPGEVALTLAAGTAAGILGTVLWQRYQVSKTAPGGLPPSGGAAGLIPVSATGGAQTITLTPGTQTYVMDVQTVVIIYLPQGGTWISDNGSPLGDKVSPQAFLFQGPIVHDYVWIDAQGKQQTSELHFQLTPGAPSVND